MLHLSTALAPIDRELVIQRVRRLLLQKNYSDWALVATSCVEAGVDFSFRTAIRESCSVASLIQTGGRVNRHGEWESCGGVGCSVAGPAIQPKPGFRCVAKSLEARCLRRARLEPMLRPP